MEQTWAALPACDCREWFEGYTAGLIQGRNESREQLDTEQLAEQARWAEFNRRFVDTTLTEQAARLAREKVYGAERRAA